MTKPTNHQNITKMPQDQLAAVLRAAGAADMTPARIQADLAAGAPVNDDGSMNLLAYGAWMLRMLAQKEGGHGR
jgi:hypothetical protein